MPVPIRFAGYDMPKNGAVRWSRLKSLTYRVLAVFKCEWR